MTAFAGVYHFDRQRSIDSDLRSRLRNALSRHPRNTVREFLWPGAYLVHVDIGAFGHPSLVESDAGGVAAAAGQVLSDHRPLRDRRHEVRGLGDELLRGDSESLLAARGTFCAVVYDPRSHRLVLAGDRLGVRPIYWWSDRDRVVFSTSMRVLEGLSTDLGLRMDVQGVAEICAFGYPLGDRTPFSDVRCLQPAEVIDFFDGRERKSRWFRWDRVPDRPDSGDADLTMLYESFMAAIRLRLGEDRVTQSFLSGGLDSRCIATGLVASGATVYTYNFSWPRTYDQVLGGEYARSLGTIHHDQSVAHLSDTSLSSLIGDAVAGRAEWPGGDAERPGLAWSGDGGSVGLGRVYLDERMVELLRAGRRDEAVAAFLRANPAALPSRLMRVALRANLSDAPARAVVEELMRLDCGDPGKGLLIFLLENDQRRHLAGHFENLDLTRVEWALPFFDADFLTKSVSLPLDVTLKHRLYNRWLVRFPGPVASVPWQAYPGHEPCPLPVPPGIEVQWDAQPKQRSWLSIMRDLRIRLMDVVSPHFPGPLFSRTRMLGAWCLGIGDHARHAYAFAALRVFAHYYGVCERRIG